MFRIRAIVEEVECDETSLRLTILNSDSGTFPGRIIQVRYSNGCYLLEELDILLYYKNYYLNSKFAIANPSNFSHHLIRRIMSRSSIVIEIGNSN